MRGGSWGSLHHLILSLSAQGLKSSPDFSVEALQAALLTAGEAWMQTEVPHRTAHLHTMHCSI